MVIRCTGLITAVLLAACQSSPTTLSDAANDGQPLDASAEAAPDAAPTDASQPPALYLQVDPTLPSWVAPRFKALLAQATSLPIKQPAATKALTNLGSGSVVLSLGATAATEALIPKSDAKLAALKPDGFVLRSAQQGGVIRVAALGKHNAKHHGLQVNLGTLYGAYAALERLGFGFLHPLDPLVPATLTLPAAPLDEARSPRWPERGIHVHTMHPLELTDMLNGWGPKGTADAAGFTASLAEWTRYCEWLLANRQNLVEWVLLKGKSWATFAESSERQSRLKALVKIAHDHGIGVGVDVGIALAQQHNFRLIEPSGDLTAEKAQLRQRVDWLLAAGFDFVSTEIGTSEFTSPDDTRMLAWIDELGTHLQTKHNGKRAHIKIHCSTGQTAPNYNDPKTGKPINYNFLPHFAIPEIGVLPHTVQVYALDDPAPTYGNTDFSFMRDFMRMEAGRRDVLWHPETAYWVSYDVDVPLFLPVYAHRRLRDLRLIAADEGAGLMGEGANKGARIQGQMIFSSGWEWGYWLNDVITARAAYDPRTSHKTDGEALQAALAAALRPFGAAAAPLAQLLVKIAEDQRDLLILGRVAGKLPSTVVKRNGQAYLQGWEAFDDVGGLVSNLPGVPRIETQPEKLGLVDMRNPLHGGPSYSKELRPLLAAMDTAFSGHLKALQALTAQVPTDARPLFDELVDSVAITALRARQILGLYDYVDGLDLLGSPSAAAKAALKTAQTALDDAAKLVVAREKAYRVPAERIAGWRDNPTAYPFAYLWTARSLHYWWRDEGKAVKGPWSPCYLNIMDPASIAFGEGFWVDAAPWIQKVLKAVGLGAAVGQCLTGPASEPSYPPAGLRP